MIKRVYIKAISIIDSIIGELHYAFERKGILKTINYTIVKEFDEKVRVEHTYPINFDKKDKALFDHCTGYDTNELIVYQLSNVNVGESGVVFKKFNNCWLSFPHTVFRAEYGWLYFLQQYLFRKKQIGDPNKTYVLLFDFWSAYNYYHFIVDTLPRLLMVKDELKDKKFSLLLPENCAKFVKAILAYFDIADITYIKSGHYLSAQSLILPYYAAGSGHIHPIKLREIKKYLVEKVNLPSSKKLIYVSRSRQKARLVINEKAIIECLLQFGFEVVHFEDYTFEEQVSIGKNAKIMVTSHGANLTNSMFMEENLKVLELIRADKPNFCYWALCSVLNIKYHYQLCKVVGNDHLLVDVELFKLNLQKLLND